MKKPAGSSHYKCWTNNPPQRQNASTHNPFSPKESRKVEESASREEEERRKHKVEKCNSKKIVDERMRHQKELKTSHFKTKNGQNRRRKGQNNGGRTTETNGSSNGMAERTAKVRRKPTDRATEWPKERRKYDGNQRIQRRNGRKNDKKDKANNSWMGEGSQEKEDMVYLNAQSIDAVGATNELELQPVMEVSIAPSAIANETSSRAATPLLRPSASVSSSIPFSFRIGAISRSSFLPSARNGR
ncbi:MLO-like protein 11 isoform X1 [Senna tora]|uniref:MLO-like protein 11 isoform X1 n=1 Tax=Senna tora TaxID=362788 RepID=A0A834SN03_9FABA|nr:MLO-like protein 11 isoform X1 [Senna tora]